MQKKKGGAQNRRNKSQRGKASRIRDDPNFFEKEFRIQHYSGLDNQVYSTVKTFNLSQVTTSTSVNTFRSYAFTLAQIADATEMASVFDQYRIKYVEVKFIPNITESLSSTPLAGGVFTCIDLDDANLFTSLTDPLDYNSLSIWKPMETIQLAFKPRMAIGAYGSAVFGSFANVEPMWLDAASTTVEHYGLKVAWGTTTTAVTYSPIARLHIEWRAQH